jgi:hypothetical protein
MQPTTGDMRQTIYSRQRAKMASNRKRGAFNGQQPPCDGQQTTCKGKHAACYPCEMQQETHGIAAFRISCAASSGQRTTSSMREALYSTTSAQHGTDAPQDDATCTIRPLPQHATNKHATDHTQRAMECTG